MDLRRSEGVEVEEVGGEGRGERTGNVYGIGSICMVLVVSIYAGFVFHLWGMCVISLYVGLSGRKIHNDNI